MVKKYKYCVLFFVLFLQTIIVSDYKDLNIETNSRKSEEETENLELNTIALDFWENELPKLYNLSLNYDIGSIESYNIYFKRQNITLYYNNMNVTGYFSYYKTTQINDVVMYFAGFGSTITNNYYYTNPFLWEKDLVVNIRMPPQFNLMFFNYTKSYQYLCTCVAIMFHRILEAKFNQSANIVAGYSFGGLLAMWFSGIFDIKNLIIYSSSYNIKYIEDYPESKIWHLFNLSSPLIENILNYTEPINYLKDDIELLISIGTKDEYFPLVCPLSEIERNGYSFHVYLNQTHFLHDFKPNIKIYLTESEHEKISFY